MEMIHVFVAATAAVSALTALSAMQARANARLLREQVDRFIDKVGNMQGALEVELDRRDAICLDISKAVVVLDRRIQRTIDDPILALDEDGKLVVYDSPLPPPPPMTGGDGSHA